LGRAKQIIVRPIAKADADRIVRRLHYSGKVVQNSQVHLGVFLDGRCGGALQFGPSLDKRKLQHLVAGTRWNDFLELNRMALADWLPRNGESRSLAVSMRLLKRQYRWLKWVVSFADAAQCGDGMIYRAAGFVLTGIAKNTAMWRMPDGRVVCKVNLEPGNGAVAEKLRYGKRGGEGATRFLRRIGAVPIAGHQLRYLYFLDAAARHRLTVPVIPFSRIDQLGAAMYRGEPRAGSVDSGTLADQAGGGGATPTPALFDGRCRARAGTEEKQ